MLSLVQGKGKVHELKTDVFSSFIIVQLWDIESLNFFETLFLSLKCKDIMFVFLAT